MKIKELNVDTKIQQMMAELGCTGDRVKPQDIVERITDIEFNTVVQCGTKMMYCAIAMRTNDPERPFVVVGNPSVCIDESNWRDAIGKQISFDNTFHEIYKLEAYRKMTAPKAADHPPARAGFKLYEGKPIVREAHQLTEVDLDFITYRQVGEDIKAVFTIDGQEVVFAFHCKAGEMKVGDYVVFINEKDTYHCSKEVFEERNHV